MRKYSDSSGFILWLLAVTLVAVFAASFSPAFYPEWYQQLNKLSGIAHWLPRLSLAATFIYHAFPKVAMTGQE